MGCAVRRRWLAPALGLAMALRHCAAHRPNARAGEIYGGGDPLRHAWLGVAGLLALGMPNNVTSPDALIHAITIGFTLSMIMGHALVILPAVAGIRISYSPLLFAPLAILQAAVCHRVLADSFLMDWRWASALMTVLALAVFAILVVAPPKPSRGD